MTPEAWIEEAKALLEQHVGVVEATPPERFVVIARDDTHYAIASFPLASLRDIADLTHCGADALPTELPPDTTARLHRIAIVLLVGSIAEPWSDDNLAASLSHVLTLTRQTVGQA